MRFLPFFTVAVCLSLFFSCNSRSRRQREEKVAQANTGTHTGRIVTPGGTISEIVCALIACSSIVATDKAGAPPPRTEALLLIQVNNQKIIWI